jgi:hypothetical protein
LTFSEIALTLILSITKKEIGMAFVMFPNDGQRVSAPRAALTKGGVISFNRSAVKKFGLADYQRCILYYDADEQKIGVEFSNDETNNATVTLRHRVSGAEISSKNFFSYFNILPTELILCEIERAEQENRLILNVKEGVTKERSQEA